MKACVCGVEIDEANVEDTIDHALCDWPDGALTKNRLATLKEEDTDE